MKLREWEGGKETHLPKLKTLLLKSTEIGFSGKVENKKNKRNT